MRVWRWVIALLIVINAISGLFPAITAITHKLGLYAPSEDSPVLALFRSLSWPVLIIWLASMASFLVSAGLLITGKGRPLLLYVLAFVGDLFVYISAQGPEYDAAFSRSEKVASYVMFVLLVPVGGAVWNFERRQRTQRSVKKDI